MMKIITPKVLARGVAEKWKRIHSLAGSWHIYPSKEYDYHRLVALGPDPDPKDIERIIGHAGWTRVHCDECDQSVEVAMMFWDVVEDDEESVPIRLCRGCLGKATERLDT